MRFPSEPRVFTDGYLLPANLRYWRNRAYKGIPLTFARRQVRSKVFQRVRYFSLKSQLLSLPLQGLPPRAGGPPAKR